MHRASRWAILIAYASAVIITIAGSFYSSTIRRFILEPYMLVECFMLLGMITSDFLTPSLSYISSNILHISDRISGMTLLALGNAIPEITSTYQSMDSDITNLALGQLLGGIFFLVTVVIGGMGLATTIRIVDDQKDKDEFILLPESSNPSAKLRGVKGKKLVNEAYHKRHYIQDIAIFTSMMLISVGFLADGKLYFWECGLMMVSYGVCAIIFIYNYMALDNTISTTTDNNYFMERVENLLHAEPNKVQNTVVPRGFSNFQKFDKGARSRRTHIRNKLRSYLRRTYHGWVKMTLHDCIDIWENINELEKDNMRTKIHSIEDLQHVIASRLECGRNRSASLQVTPSNAQLPTFLYTNYTENRNCDNANPKHHKLRGDMKHIQEAVQSPTSPTSVITSGPNSPLIFNYTRPQTSHKALSVDHLPIVHNRHFDHPTLSGTSTTEEQGSSDEENISLLGDTAVLLHDSISQGSFERRDIIQGHSGNSKLYHYLKDADVSIPKIEYISLLFTTPASLILYLVIPVLDQKEGDIITKNFQLFQVVLAPIFFRLLVNYNIDAISIALASVIALTLFSLKRRGAADVFPPIIALTAFIISLCGTSCVVHLTVTILMSWAEAFNLSQAIIGTTVFAWGNSIGDLVSNIAFAKIGVMDIALGACFGSPLLYFLFGTGMDGMIILIKRNHWTLNWDLWSHCIEYEVDSKLICTGVGILLSFVIFTVGVPMNGWLIDRNISILLLSLYMVITAFNVFIEIK